MLMHTMCASCPDSYVNGGLMLVNVVPLPPLFCQKGRETVPLDPTYKLRLTNESCRFHVYT